MSDKEVPDMLRFFIKVLLFPITLALTLLVAFARFFCLFSRMVLSIIAGAFFLFGVLMLFIGEWQDGRYKQYAESNLIAIHKPGTAAEKCCRVQFR